MTSVICVYLFSIAPEWVNVLPYSEPDIYNGGNNHERVSIAEIVLVSFFNVLNRLSNNQGLATSKQHHNKSWQYRRSKCSP